MKEITERIDALLKTKERVIVAIDGRCGSGKSTLGKALSEYYDAVLFHMDDFYLQQYQRTAERYSIPGENVDHERFLREVLIPLKHMEDEIDYRVFLPSLMQIQDGVRIQITPLVIIEGSYSMHVSLREYYDLKIFSDIDPELQKKRLMKRDPSKYDDFIEKWIPLEEMYFQKNHIREICDMTIVAEESYGGSFLQER